MQQMLPFPPPAFSEQLMTSRVAGGSEQMIEGMRNGKFLFHMIKTVSQAEGRNTELRCGAELSLRQTMYTTTRSIDNTNAALVDK